LGHDKLGRRGFAEAAAKAVARGSAIGGFVLSIEGAWGSGKTSTLSMMQALLQQQQHAPVVVHFNPWLIGDRDALLKQFLVRISAEIKLADHAAEGKRVARELNAYGKVFDLVKLVPGAEPWASLIKSVVEAAGEATEAVATHKIPDVEVQKRKVEAALREYPRSIVVIIDDIDRLFPLEVFEVVRIIKAVADLPRVGYVVAWDPDYVARTLRAAKVPMAEQYLDKIVQLRMPLPAISLEARGRLLNDALSRLAPEAREERFDSDRDRLASLYFSGLRDLLEQPRDVGLIFNTVAAIEPALRGELSLADIIGFGALMVKAPHVYQLIRRQPRWFVGLLPGDLGIAKQGKDVIKDGTHSREAAIAKCSRPEPVRNLVHRLFPQTATADDALAIGEVSEIEGHIGAPARLLVALQLHVGGGDVSLVRARRYLLHPNEREGITSELTQRNCLEFMECLGNVAHSSGAIGISDVNQLCLAIARLADTGPFVARSADRSGFFSVRAENVASRVIYLITRAAGHTDSAGTADQIVADERSLTVGMELFVRSFVRSRQDGDGPICTPGAKERLADELANNIVSAAATDRLFATCNPGFLLWSLPRVAPRACGDVFHAVKSTGASLDAFALATLSESYDSDKGQRYSFLKNRALIETYCPLEEFKTHAARRLADRSVPLPAAAAWKAVVEERSFYGVDGSFAPD